jgi:putative ABC transport system permease protein
MGWLQSQTKLFRALLYCYPAAFRHEYGLEMEQLFADRLRSEPHARLWFEALADLLLTAPKEHWHILRSDLRYGARILAATPVLSLVAILVVALGTGATTAIFSLVNAVLLRSLPYGHTEQLVYLWSPNPRFEGVPSEMAPNVPDFYDWQRQTHSFSSITMLRQSAVNLVRDGSASRVQAAFVTGNFFSTLQAAPVAGRSVDASDDQPGHQHVAVISDRLWRSHFGSDPGALGKQIQLNRERYTVIGVMPRDFGYPFDGDIPYGQSGFKQTDIWLPAVYTTAQKTDRVNFDSASAAIGRLRAGVLTGAAEKELASIQARLDSLYPEMWRGWTVLVRPLVQTIVGPVEKMLWLLLGSVSVVMLIAISNVANLLFARARARSHEVGIRTALGAERGRIIRQLLTESLLLSGAGGALGIAVAYAAVHLLVQMNPGDIPRFDAITVDGRVLLVAVLLSIATGVAAGMAPALSTSRASVNTLLKRGGNRVAGGSNRGRFAIIVMEVALSVILLAGAGLLIRSYLQIQAVDPGFSPRTLTFRLPLDERYRNQQARSVFYQDFLNRLQKMPGVKRAGASSSIPLSGNESVTFAEIRGFGKSKQMVEGRDVTPDYLRALGTPLLVGRNFTALDVSSKTRVALVNRKFAEVFFRGRDPIGQQVRLGMGDFSSAEWMTVTGVVGDIRHNKLEEAGLPQIFEVVDSGQNFAVQSDATRPVVEQARAVLRSLDSTLTLEDIQTMGERISGSNTRRRFQTMLLTGFGGIAIVLALVGLYGLMSYSVKERTAEIGIRAALGSSRLRLVGLILGQGMRLTVTGLAIGIAGAFALTRLVQAWLFGVQATDWVTFVAVPLFVLIVSCCACLIPAWSATRIDPIRALREQ